MPERPIRFPCERAHLYGMLHLPSTPGHRGVVVVVGGPQYRVGSHRQFVLLARDLAQAGIPVLRFDYRGMGDSEGEPRTFENIDADIRAAIEQLLAAVPGVDEIVLWGLCDAASAALCYAPRDPRVTGVVLLNPWVRTEAGIAGAYLQRYYRQRLLDPSFWRKVWRGELDVRASARSLFHLASARLGARKSDAPSSQKSLPQRMLEDFQRYQGRVLLILSGDDLTAEEFRRLANGSHAWRRQLRRRNVTRRDLAPANHTFSRCEWRDQVASWTREWVQSW